MDKASSEPFAVRLAAIATWLAQIELDVADADRRASEVLWAHILNDTARESCWFVNSDILPHQYASGHQTLYVLCRILTERRPMRVFCVGDGVMLRVVRQYAHSIKDVKVYRTRWRGNFPFDLVCVEMGQSAVVPPRIKISENGIIVVNDVYRVLKSGDIDYYANLIRNTGREIVIGKYEGYGTCYVMTGKNDIYLTSM